MAGMVGALFKAICCFSCVFSCRCVHVWRCLLLFLLTLSIVFPCSSLLLSIAVNCCPLLSVAGCVGVSSRLWTVGSQAWPSVACAGRCCAVLCCALLCCNVLHCGALCRAVLCSALLRYLAQGPCQTIHTTSHARAACQTAPHNLCSTPRTAHLAQHTSNSTLHTAPAHFEQHTFSADTLHSSMSRTRCVVVAHNVSGCRTQCVWLSHTMCLVVAHNVSGCRTQCVWLSQDAWWTSQSACPPPLPTKASWERWRRQQQRGLWKVGGTHNQCKAHTRRLHTWHTQCTQRTQRTQCTHHTQHMQHARCTTHGTWRMAHGSSFPAAHPSHPSLIQRT